MRGLLVWYLFSLISAYLTPNSSAAGWIPKKRRMEGPTWTSATPSTPLAPGGADVPVTRSKKNRFFGTLQKFVSVPYNPDTQNLSFLDRAQSQSKDSVDVKVAVMSSAESKRYFGRAISKRGIQPVFLQVTNRSKGPLFFDCVRLDPNYYPPLEAAGVCHFWNLQQLLASFGLFLVLFIPLLALLPLKFISAHKANKRMDEFFCSQNFPRGFIQPGETVQGFVFCSLDDGTKCVNVKLLGETKSHEYEFSVPVPGIAVDYEGKSDFLTRYPQEQLEYCDLDSLKQKLESAPRATTNPSGNREGDPANLVVIADFETLLTAFGAEWDETEIISLATCYKTAKSFVLGSPYRYCPVSALYLFGRSQDFALQRARDTVSERLHLRLWITPLRYNGKPVWMGQISRDIGVKMAKTWNLTTHKVDPNVDEARDYLMSCLLESGHLESVGLVDGVGVSTEEHPRKNLGNDPYVTDGKRAVVTLSPAKTQAKILKWNDGV